MHNVKPFQENLAAKPWEFHADYSELLTPEEAEQELSGFKFEGAGWYLTNADTLLVIPVDESHYLFCVYGNRNPNVAFNWIVNAPIRSDNRSMPMDEIQIHELIVERDIDNSDED